MFHMSSSSSSSSSSGCSCTTGVCTACSSPRRIRTEIVTTNGQPVIPTIAVRRSLHDRTHYYEGESRRDAPCCCDIHEHYYDGRHRNDIPCACFAGTCTACGSPTAIEVGRPFHRDLPHYAVESRNDALCRCNRIHEHDHHMGKEGRSNSACACCTCPCASCVSANARAAEKARRKHKKAKKNKKKNNTYWGKLIKVPSYFKGLTASLTTDKILEKTVENPIVDILCGTFSNDKKTRWVEDQPRRGTMLQIQQRRRSFPYFARDIDWEPSIEDHYFWGDAGSTAQTTTTTTTTYGMAEPEKTANGHYTVDFGIPLGRHSSPEQFYIGGNDNIPRQGRRLSGCAEQNVHCYHHDTQHARHATATTIGHHVVPTFGPFGTPYASDSAVPAQGGANNIVHYHHNMQPIEPLQRPHGSYADAPRPPSSYPRHYDNHNRHTHENSRKRTSTTECSLFSTDCSPRKQRQRDDTPRKHHRHADGTPVTVETTTTEYRFFPDDYSPRHASSPREYVSHSSAFSTAETLPPYSHRVSVISSPGSPKHHVETRCGSPQRTPVIMVRPPTDERY